MAAVFRIARWLAWQISELERPADCPPARITVIPGSRGRD